MTDDDAFTAATVGIDSDAFDVGVEGATSEARKLSAWRTATP